MERPDINRGIILSRVPLMAIKKGSLLNENPHRKRTPGIKDKGNHRNPERRGSHRPGCSNLWSCPPDPAKKNDPEQPLYGIPAKKNRGCHGACGSTRDKTNLPDELKSGMESSFNQDFSHVRVHANSSKAPEVGALAYTQGSDVHFAPGQFSPGTSSGRQLIGHELAHVVQQGQGRVAPTTEISGMPVNDNPALEREADVLGSRASR